jgi:hypothetical protein
MELYKTRPIRFYVIATIVAWVIVLTVVFFLGSGQKFHDAAIVCAGFYFGMLAMFIATNFYCSPMIWKNQNRLNEPKNQGQK